jgi:hypothetical protein
MCTHRTCHRTGYAEVRRSRRLVVSFIMTAVNYECVGVGAQAMHLDDGARQAGAVTCAVNMACGHCRLGRLRCISHLPLCCVRCRYAFYWYLQQVRSRAGGAA